MDLTTALGDLRLDTPVMTAAGCGGWGRELAGHLTLAQLAAFVTPSVRRDPTPGHGPPRMVETPGGLLTSNGLPGPGIDGFLARDLPWLLQEDARPIVSIAGTSLGELAELARRVGQTPGVAALEVSLSWPGAGAVGSPLAADSVQVGRAVATVRREAPRGLPVLAKVGVETPDLLGSARAVRDAGADALVVGGSAAGLDLDLDTLRPRPRGMSGAVSGPAVRPLAMHAVWQVAQAEPDLPVVGVGGITSGADALGLLAAGASAVQVGTAVLHDPTAPGRIVAQLCAALAEHGYSRPDDAVGVAHRR